MFKRWRCFAGDKKMKFSKALEELEAGKKIRRSAYENGFWLEIKEMWISGHE